MDRRKKKYSSLACFFSTVVKLNPSIKKDSTEHKNWNAVTKDQSLVGFMSPL